MAITTVRVLLGGTWTNLTFNPATGFYEGEITAPYPPGIQTITCEATNSGGYKKQGTATIDIRAELIPPVVTITGPDESGWYTDKPITFTLRDEAGGSGINLSSLSVVLDGEKLTSTSAGMVCNAVSNGYDCTYSPPTPLVSGYHTVSITVKDNAENQSATVSRGWNVDITPPELTVTHPPVGFVTNQPSLTVTGRAKDTGVGLDTVTVNGKQATFPAYQIGTVYLDGTATVNGNGTEASPYNDFSLALDRAGDGGTILILGTVTLTNPVSYSADVTIMPAKKYSPWDSAGKGSMFNLNVVGSGEIALNEMIISSVYDERAVAPSAMVTGEDYTASLTLQEGYNTITVIAKDKLGNTATVTRTVLLDTTPPAFVSVHIAPDLDAHPMGQTFIITVVMADSFRPKSKEYVTGTVNGQSVTYTESPELTWTAKVTRAIGDTYDVYLYAYDEAGNTAENSVYFPCGMESKWTWEPIEYLNYWDLNRIERNTEYLRRWMEEVGIGTGITFTKYDWEENGDPKNNKDRPIQSDIDRVRHNVDALQKSFMKIPDWIEITYNTGFNYEQVNAIEWDLHLLDLWMDNAAKSQLIYSGQIYSGMWY